MFYGSPTLLHGRNGVLLGSPLVVLWQLRDAVNSAELYINRTVLSSYGSSVVIALAVL